MNGMLFTHLRELFPHLLFALLSGIITSVILLGALLIGFDSMESVLAHMTQTSAESAEVDPAFQYAAVAVFLASLLATAPLIGWRYNFLLRMFSVDTPNEEAER